MMLRKFLAAALTFTAFSAPAYATVVYDFTFNNAENGGGTVDGTVTLPSSADGTYMASSVVVTSNSNAADFGLGQYVGHPFTNSFVVSGGNITNLSVFLDFGVRNSSPAVTCCSLEFNAIPFGGVSFFAGGLTDNAGSVDSSTVDTLTFTLAPAAVPEPATLPLLATGLGVLGLLGWRRKRKAEAVA